MSQNQAFLQEFEGNMQRLSQINGIIQKNIQDRKNFSAYIVEKLGTINQTVQALAERVQALKTLVDQTQTRVNSNSDEIMQKQREIDALQAQLQKTTEEKDALQQEFQALQQKCQTDLTAAQTQIQQLTAQIQQITADNAALQQRVKSLEDELRNTGADGAKNAEELRRQGEAFQQLTDNLTAENNKKIAELNQIIQMKEQEKTQLNEALRQEQEKYQQAADALNQSQSQNAANMQGLQKNIADLTAENQLLIGRLKDANTAIVNALELLDQLTNDGVDRENTQNVNAAFQAIEQSLENINRALQGQASAPASAAPASRSVNKISGNDVVHLIDYVGNPVDLLYKDIVGKLAQKASSSQKHNNALREIRVTNDIRDIPRILNKYGVAVKNNQIFGGKKYKKYSKTRKLNTKKLKKQKGGFFYKTNSKRKSLLTYSVSSYRKRKNSKTSKKL